jgi:hypothetical protein
MKLVDVRGNNRTVCGAWITLDCNAARTKGIGRRKQGPGREFKISLRVRGGLIVGITDVALAPSALLILSRGWSFSYAAGKQAWEAGVAEGWEQVEWVFGGLLTAETLLTRECQEVWSFAEAEDGGCDAEVASDSVAYRIQRNTQSQHQAAKQLRANHLEIRHCIFRLLLIGAPKLHGILRRH